MVCANFNGPSLACADCELIRIRATSGRAKTRTHTWQPTTIWKNPMSAGSGSQPGAYTDSVTGVTYLFAGSR